MGTKIAWTGELKLLEARWTDKDGHTANFQLVAPNDEKPNPFSVFTKRRGGKAGTRFHMTAAHVLGPRDTTVAYDDEVMLAGWGHSSTAGYTVRFWLRPPDTGVHPLELYSRGTDTFMIALAELDDDDTVIDQTKRERVEKDDGRVAQQVEHRGEDSGVAGSTPAPATKRGQALSNVAFMIANTPEFWAWLETEGRGTVSSEVGATLVLKQMIGIQSRKELDLVGEAAERFHRLIRKPFAEFVTERVH